MLGRDKEDTQDLDRFMVRQRVGQVCKVGWVCGEWWALLVCLS